MKQYNIWSEGYVCTGNRSGAIYHGTATGKTFKAACIDYFSDKENDERGDFDKKDMTFWGCRLYDNEVDARGSFG